MALTPEQIVSAVDTLNQQGKPPTLRAIRDLLGTGSLGTISRILQSLKEAPPADPPRVTVPPGVFRVLEEAFATLERQVRGGLEEERQIERRQGEMLEEENLRFVSRIVALEEQVRQMTEERQKTEGRIDEIRRHGEILDRALEREREERLRAEKQASVLEGERNGLLGQMADLRERLEKAILPAKATDGPAPVGPGSPPSRKRIRRLT